VAHSADDKTAPWVSELLRERLRRAEAAQSSVPGCSVAAEIPEHALIAVADSRRVCTPRRQRLLPG